MNSSRPLEPMAEARERILSASRVLSADSVEPEAAIGRIIPVAVTSPVDLPRFSNSQMDGYAVRSQDCSRPGVTLTAVGTVMAGSNAEVGVGPGETMRIMTGAPLPRGADAVCPLEEVDMVDSRITFGIPVSPSMFVRSPGDDLRAGSLIIAAGSILDPVGAGLLVAVGIDLVTAIRRPRVGVLSTGDELVVAERIEDGQARIYDANRTVLGGMIAGSGFDALDLGIIADDEDEFIARILDAAEHCDAIVTTGGVSVGDRDVVRTALDRLPTSTAVATAVAIKPGKPHVFAVLKDGGTLLFGLPGNPVSAFVTFELFVRPALRKLAGCSELTRPHVTAVAGDDFSRSGDGKLHLRPVRFDVGWPLIARTDGRTGSHILSAVHDVDALALLPDGSGVRAGESVECMVLRADRAFESALAAVAVASER